jgi:hypothetical protein
MKLIDKDQDEEGWTMVSDALYPHLSHNMPKELVEFGVIAGRHRARLTEEGVSVVNVMKKWL